MRATAICDKAFAQDESERTVEMLIRKLEGFGPLPEADKELLRGLTVRVRELEPRQDIICEGDTPSDVHLVETGFACRYKLVEGGRRQIVAFLVPGDFCDLHVFILRQMDHSIATLSRSTVIDIPRDGILQLLGRSALSRALLMTTLVDDSVLRD